MPRKGGPESSSAELDRTSEDAPADCPFRDLETMFVGQIGRRLIRDLLEEGTPEELLDVVVDVLDPEGELYEHLYENTVCRARMAALLRKRAERRESCPGFIEKLRYAIEPAADDLAPHIEGCAECTEDVRLIKSALPNGTDFDEV